MNLTLSVDVLRQARASTDNLSALVERMLADFIHRESLERQAKADAAERTAALWNEFNSGMGSFADDHSTL